MHPLTCQLGTCNRSACCEADIGTSHTEIACEQSPVKSQPDTISQRASLSLLGQCRLPGLKAVHLQTYLKLRGSTVMRS